MISAEYFTDLLARLAAVTTPGEYRPPRCACGADLGVWVGRHSGYTFIIHPRLSRRDCPRAAYRNYGKTAKEAMFAYLEKAPDLGALDEHPEAKAAHDPDPDFSSEFQ